MNNTLKKGFSLFRDEESLRYAIDLVCAKYGKVESLTIFPARRDYPGKSFQCLCVLRLNQPQAHLALWSAVRVSTLGRELAFVADVDDAWSGSRV